MARTTSTPNPETFADFGLTVAPQPETSVITPDPVDLIAAAELSVATYEALDLVADKAKAQEMFTKAFTGLTDKLPESVTAQAYDLVMVPKLGNLSLSGLISKFDSLSTSKKPFREAYVFSEFWDQYGDDELNQGQITDLSPQAVLLETANDYDEAGLHFTNQNLGIQRKSIKTAQKAHSKESPATSLHTQSTASYVIRQAMQRIRDEQPVDADTFTRFAELDNKSADGFSYVPDAGWYADRLDLGRSLGVAYPNAGVRLSVGSET